MRALVTGLAGFTGRYVAAELESIGYEVWGIGDHVANRPRYVVADLAKANEMEDAVAQIQPNVVVHLAAIAFVGHGDPEAFYRVNLIGTRNLLAALARAGSRINSVLLASSANIYGNAASGMLSEETLPNPANDYAVSKLAMEYMANLWMDRLPIVVTRPFNYTGVGQSESFLLPKIVSHFRRRAQTIELGNLDVWRDFSDVRALAAAYRRLIEKRVSGTRVNICSGNAHSLGEVIAMAEQITGHRIQIEVNPAFVRANEVKMLCGDPSKLRALIGDWRTPDLQETLRWMLEAEEA